MGPRRRRRDRRGRGGYLGPAAKRAERARRARTRGEARRGRDHAQRPSTARSCAASASVGALMEPARAGHRSTSWPPTPEPRPSRSGASPAGTLRSMSNGYRVAVVGATGQVGTLMLELLRERGFPAREIVPFASERSVGRELDGGLVVQGLERGLHPGLRPGALLRGRLHLGRVGATVRRGRGGRDRQLLALAHARRRPAGRQRGQPRCARRPSRDHRQPELLDDADGRGAEAAPRRGRDRAAGDLAPTRPSPVPAERAVDELLDQSHALLHEREIASPDAYAHQIAFNALPHAGCFAAATTTPTRSAS